MFRSSWYLPDCAHSRAILLSRFVNVNLPEESAEYALRATTTLRESHLEILFHLSGNKYSSELISIPANRAPKDLRNLTDGSCESYIYERGRASVFVRATKINRLTRLAKRQIVDADII